MDDKYYFEKDEVLRELEFVYENCSIMSNRAIRESIYKIIVSIKKNSGYCVLEEKDY